MIASFRDKETERLWRVGKSRRIPTGLQRTAFKKLAILNAAVALENLRRAFKKLAILNAAVALENLRVPPGNELEALRGNRFRPT